ncbi:MAG: lysylphosphatidylglycerol synthase domain-containing protein [Pseudomonadota bacterium]|nr:lysylphosphatidylglycerol synthase domain-containing protein [Pseudomonadota bacterium]
MKKFHLAALILGVALLVFLIWKIGPAAIWRDMHLLGWGLVPFVLLEGVAKVFHTIAWRRCLVPPHSSLPLSRLYNIDLAGGAINYFTPTATVGGEVVKGALLAAEHQGPGAATGIIINKLSYALSQFATALIGSLLVIWRISLPTYAYGPLLAGNLFLGAGLAGFLIVQRQGKLGAVLRWIATRLRLESLKRAAAYITEIDQDLRRFYREDPRGLWASSGWHLAGFVVSMVKTWYFLYLFQSDSFFTAAAAWLLATWLDLLVFFIPLEIGLQEGIRVVVFSVLGFTAALGLTYGIALRLEQIFWGAVGLGVYWAIMPDRRVEASPTGEG